MIENIDIIDTLEDFWKNATGVVVDFINRNGESVDDMDYSITTKINNIRHIEDDQYEVELDV